MIFVDDARLVFLHVPKCGGTSVRSALTSLSEVEDRYNGRDRHPSLGKYYRAHISLRELREFFPEEFSKVRNYASFAVCRDPLERFASALYQWDHEFNGTNVYELSPADRYREVEHILGVLNAHGDTLPFEFTHFRRQMDYFELDGKRIVKRIYSLEKIEFLFADMQEYLARDFPKLPHDNQTIKPRIAGTMNLLLLCNKAARRLMPRDTYAYAKRFMMPVLTAPRRGQSTAPLLADEQIEFLRKYYQRDIEIYTETVRRMETRCSVPAFGRSGRG